ncbi:MAG TPA: FUSC family protein [Ancylobacter sp.]
MDDITRQSLATATGVVAGVYLALWAGLEQPYWAAISALIIANVDRGALFTKGVLRVVGTVGGVISGYMVSLLLEGFPVFQGLLLMLAAGTGMYLRQRTRYPYAWFYGALSFMLVLLCSMSAPDTLYSFAVYRFWEIVIGVVAATLASWTIGRRDHTPWGIAAQEPTLSPNEAARQAFAAAVGVITIVVGWAAFNLPSVIQVVISSLVVVDSNVNNTRHRGWQRILGCIIGGATGLLAMAVDASDFLWWTASLFAGVFLFSRIHLGKTPNAYVGTQSALAFIVTLVDSGPPDSILPPLNRLIGIVVGVSIMTIIVWAMNARRPVPVPAG